MFKIGNSITYFEILTHGQDILEKNNKDKFVAEWLMRERLNWTKTELVQHYRKEIKPNEVSQYKKDIKMFLDGFPMQYIIGHDWFYNRQFKVNPNTLIPRPETEEWLDQVLSILPDKSLNVLDIGTGTGVLAITHKLERPQDQVMATDISFEALEVAKENALTLGAEVTFKQGDLLEPLTKEKFDVILCNPPYISFDEKRLMSSSVLKHEPKTALFAKEKGLEIYQRLALSLNDFLKQKSFIFLEIGYAQGKQVQQLFKEYFPKAKVEIWEDFNHLDRVVAVSNE